MMDIVQELELANIKGVAPPQDWTSRAIDEIKRLRTLLEAAPPADVEPYGYVRFDNYHNKEAIKGEWLNRTPVEDDDIALYAHPPADKDAERWKFVNGENYYAVCKYNDSPYGASYIPVDVADIDKAMREV